jgi:exodeoxyribonuclease VII large subunit
VARAVADHPVPVWTGIGHTGDQSVADIVANRAFVTPTECGAELVRRVLDWWEGATAAGRVVARRASEAVTASSARDELVRQRLGRATRHQLHRHAERLVTRAERISLQATRQLEIAGTSLARRSTVLGPRATAVVDRQAERTTTWRRLLAAYDVDRQLERGYTLTLDADGRILRSAQALTPGQELVTRFADGAARSVVDTIDVSRGEEDRL